MSLDTPRHLHEKPLETSRWRYTLLGALHLRNEVLLPLVGAGTLWVVLRSTGLKLTAPDDPVLNNAALAGLSLLAGIISTLLCRWWWHPIYLEVTPRGGTWSVLREGLGRLRRGLGETMGPLIVISLAALVLLSGLFWLAWTLRENTDQGIAQLKADLFRRVDMLKAETTARADTLEANLRAELNADRDATLQFFVADQVHQLLEPMDNVEGRAPSQLAHWITQDANQGVGVETYSGKLTELAAKFTSVADAVERHRNVYEHYENLKSMMDGIGAHFRKVAGEASVLASYIKAAPKMGVKPTYAEFLKSAEFTNFKTDADGFHLWLIGQISAVNGARGKSVSPVPSAR